MSIKGCNSVANLQKMMLYNPNLDLVNDNLYTKFGHILSIRSQDIGPLVVEIFEFENVYGRTHAQTDTRTPDRPVYYKLTFEPSAQVS